MASHPEFGERTTGAEVAQAFARQIRGKTSESRVVPSRRPAPLTGGQS
jgi:hypothetical protein